MANGKVTNGLVYSLAIISILGFVGIMAKVWFQFDFLVDNVAAYMLIVLGLGLAIEGQIKRWKKYPENGFSSNEMAHIVTGIVGMISIFVGILDLVGLTGSTLASTQAIISAIAVVIIILQTWVVD